MEGYVRQVRAKCKLEGVAHGSFKGVQALVPFAGAKNKGNAAMGVLLRVLGHKNLKMGKDVAITNFAIEHLLKYR
jgi:hypothetical protein